MMIVNIVVKLFVLAILAAVIGAVCVSWLNQRLSNTMSRNYQNGYKLPEEFVRAARQRSILIANATRLEQLRRRAPNGDKSLRQSEEPAEANELDNSPQAANG